MDFAVSADPAVQRQLDRLQKLTPGREVLGLERITALLDRLGNPEQRLPPVFHVAGTNGKGSTCAILRACAEASGLSAHVYSSPHLVRFNERIRVAGRLIDDAMLAALLAEVLDAGDDFAPSFFEASTAAAFLAFARTPADVAIVEVGLGGRLDATNVFASPAVCGIAALGLDHQQFLGDTLEAIAGEKAGIAKPDVPVVTLAYPDAADARVEAVAAERGSRRLKLGRDWTFAPSSTGFCYSDADGELELPAPALPGPHQLANAALAIAMIRHQRALVVSRMAAGLTAARWPARLQRLSPGPLVRGETWLDGGHNPSAGEAIAAHFAGRSLDVVIGMLANKDAATFLKLLAPVARSLTAVPINGHECHAPEYLAGLARGLGLDARTAADLPQALKRTKEPVLITGSLYLAGVALSLNGQVPD